MNHARNTVHSATEGHAGAWAAPRIVLITHFFPSHRGGVEIVAGEIARRMVANGAAIIWFSSFVDSPPELIPGLSVVPVKATNVVERRLHLPYPLWAPTILPRLWKTLRAADSVHIHDFVYCGSVLAYLAAKLLRKPIVVTQHIGFIPYDGALPRLLLRFLNRFLGTLMLGRADQVLFISETVRQYFGAFVNYRHPPRLLPNGVDLDLFSPLPDAPREILRSALHLERNDMVLLFVGRFVEKKGLRILRSLASAFPHFKWLFAGQGPLDPVEWELPNVTVYRDRRGAQLAELYRAADLLVLPSKGEGFPLVVQEAMACGTPVIVGTETAAAYPGLSALAFAAPVDDAVAAAKWEHKIASLTSERRRLAAMRADVARFARREWSWEVCADAYAKLFEMLSKSDQTSPAG